MVRLMETQVFDRTVTKEAKPLTGRERSYFTSANAASMALKGQEVKRLQKLNPLPPSVTVDDFLRDELLSTRAECKRVGKLLSETKEAAEIDKLARALSTLRDQERVLAGRPLPGALRPTSRRSRGSGSNFGPTE